MRAYDVVDWLTLVPCSDLNFKGALRVATEHELNMALSKLCVPGNKTKIKAIQTEIRRRQK